MNTPLEQYDDLAHALGFQNIYFKREDLGQYGSHKGRSIPHMVDHYMKSGDTRFAISSSGNAALAAAMHVHSLNTQGGTIDLDIFVGNGIAPHKMDKLTPYASDRIRILKKERPLQALTLATQEGVRSLRQSTDDIALIGYSSLLQEIIDALKLEKKTLGALFIGTSSGTTAQALAEASLKITTPTGRPQIHIVQTSSCHPLADALTSYDGPDELSIADAITDITAYRKSTLIPLIEKIGGTAWCATNEEIETAQELVHTRTGLNISTNSTLSVVGAMQAAYTGHEIDGVVVCMICGA
jgi:threonine dehydratase